MIQTLIEYSDILTTAVVIFSIVPFLLFIKEKISERKYARLFKDLFKVILLHINFNDVCVVVKDEEGKIIFTTGKKHFRELGPIDTNNIESIEVSINNEIVVHGKSKNPIEIIEKFCMSQVDLPHSGFVKVLNNLYFFIAKKICYGEKYYYLYLYQIEPYIKMEEILEKLKSLKGLSYGVLKEDLIIFRGDEDLGLIKKELKIKCI